MQTLSDSRHSKCFLMFVCSLCLSGSAQLFADDAVHLRLIDLLDRPQDGYCVDVVGTPGNLRTDLPLFAHNCKPVLTPDSAVNFNTEGLIRFTDLELCITVAGINGTALPGTSVLLHVCGSNSAFMHTARLQSFTLDDSGKLMLDGTDLCLAVGSESATTYSTQDRWRPLYVDSCNVVESSHARWKFVQP